MHNVLRYYQSMKSEGKRVGVYVRVSTTDQSCDMQKNAINEYLEARGWANDAVYFEDAGRTGTNTNRPEFKRLMSEARARRLDIVVVFKLDRFARSLKDLILNLEELSQLGVAFISLRDAVDLTTSAGRLMVNMLGAFAAFEADLIKERVRAGLMNARAQGKQLGRPKERDDAVIRRLRADGLSLRAIATKVGVSKSSVQNSLKLPIAV